MLSPPPILWAQVAVNRFCFLTPRTLRAPRRTSGTGIHPDLCGRCALSVRNSDLLSPHAKSAKVAKDAFPLRSLREAVLWWSARTTGCFATKDHIDHKVIRLSSLPASRRLVRRPGDPLWLTHPNGFSMQHAEEAEEGPMGPTQRTRRPQRQGIA